MFLAMVFAQESAVGIGLWMLLRSIELFHLKQWGGRPCVRSRPTMACRNLPRLLHTGEASWRAPFALSCWKPKLVLPSPLFGIPLRLP